MWRAREYVSCAAEYCWRENRSLPFSLRELACVKRLVRIFSFVNDVFVDDVDDGIDDDGMVVLGALPLPLRVVAGILYY